MVEMIAALRETRARRGLTLRDAARVIGCSYQALANWETQKSEPHPLFLPGIRRFLGRQRKARDA